MSPAVQGCDSSLSSLFPAREPAHAISEYAATLSHRGLAGCSIGDVAVECLAAILRQRFPRRNELSLLEWFLFALSCLPSGVGGAVLGFQAPFLGGLCGPI